NCDPQEGHFEKSDLHVGHLCFNQGKMRGDTNMGKLKRIVFTEEQIRMLEANPNVQKVSESTITYNPAFKLEALEAYRAGQTPSEIFIRAGFDLDVIGHTKPKKSVKRWRETYQLYGEEGLETDRRGKNSTGRKTAAELTVEEELKRAQAKIKMLEAQVDLLKKLEALERQKKKH
ncbi:helix-turn-helix domain-containing protein, partial [Gorillibacterium sp. sgz5001074]|uniref:helix-turn-helix domain-containing protein n=1 Tax=Gorillibacterium sp. sgz5001074 TaxID=3446695 RepID=UPI003F67E42F